MKLTVLVMGTALAVLGAGSGLGAGAANALGIFLVAAAVDRGIDAGTAGLLLAAGSVVGFAGSASAVHE